MNTSVKANRLLNFFNQFFRYLWIPGITVYTIAYGMAVLILLRFRDKDRFVPWLVLTSLLFSVLTLVSGFYRERKYLNKGKGEEKNEKSETGAITDITCFNG